MLNRIALVLLTLAVGVWILWASPVVQAYTAIEVKDGGTISGTVKLAGAIPEPEVLNIDKDPEVCGHEPRVAEKLIVDKVTKGIKGAVVYIQKIEQGKKWEMTPAEQSEAAAPPAAETHFTLDQKQCTFIPHVQVIPAGGTLELRNGDPLMHNLHSYSMKNSSFNESIPGDGKPIHKEFKFNEVVKVGCDVHKWMSAWVVVRDNPYYCITSLDGTFKITDVPPGTYKLVIWHEAFKAETLKTQSKDVKVDPKGEAKVDLELSL